MILITEFKIILKDCTIIEMHQALVYSHGIFIVTNSESFHWYQKEFKEIFSTKSSKILHFSFNPFLSPWSAGSKSTWSHHLNKMSSAIVIFIANFVHFPSFHFASFSLDKHGQERFLYWGECRESCPPGYYPEEGHTCQPCPDNCELCHSTHVCTRCVRGYFMVPSNHTCQKLECGQGKAALEPMQTKGAVPWMPQRLEYLPGAMVAPGWFLTTLHHKWGQWYLPCSLSPSICLDTIQGLRNAANHIHRRWTPVEGIWERYNGEKIRLEPSTIFSFPITSYETPGKISLISPCLGFFICDRESIACSVLACWQEPVRVSLLKMTWKYENVLGIYVLLLLFNSYLHCKKGIKKQHI